jgi:hypothetical protein
MNSIKKYKGVLVLSIVTALAAIVYSGLCLRNNWNSPVYGWVGILILFAGVYGGMIIYKNKANEGYINFRDAYKAGIIIGAVIGIIFTLHRFIYILIFPDFASNLIARKRLELMSSHLSTEEFNHIIDVSVWLDTNFLGIIVSKLLGTVLIVAILSVLAAYLVSTRNKDFI